MGTPSRDRLCAACSRGRGSDEPHQTTFRPEFTFYVEITDWEQLRQHVTTPVKGNSEPLDVVWSAVNEVGPTRLEELEAADGGEVAPGLQLIMPPMGKGMSRGSWDANGVADEHPTDYTQLIKHLDALHKLSEDLRARVRAQYYSDADYTRSR